MSGALLAARDGLVLPYRDLSRGVIHPLFQREFVFYIPDRAVTLGILETLDGHLRIDVEILTEKNEAQRLAALHHSPEFPGVPERLMYLLPHAGRRYPLCREKAAERYLAQLRALEDIHVAELQHCFFGAVQSALD